MGLLVFTTSSILAMMVQSNDQLRRTAALQDASKRIEQRIQNQISVLYAARGLFLTSKEVTRQDFQSFISSLRLEESGRGAQGIGFALAENPKMPGQAKKWVLDYYGRSIEPWPESHQTIRFPIVLLEPADKRNIAALNYDMYTNSIRRQAMQKAWSENRAAITRPVTLMQVIDSEKQIGFLIYLPILRKQPGLERWSSDQRGIQGFVFAPFRAYDLLTTILDQPPKLNIDIQAFSDAFGPENFIYQSAEKIVSPSIHKISVAGRRWMLRLKEKGDTTSDGIGEASFAMPYTVFGILAVHCFWCLGASTNRTFLKSSKDSFRNRRSDEGERITSP